MVKSKSKSVFNDRLNNNSSWQSVLTSSAKDLKYRIYKKEQKKRDFFLC